MRFLRPVFGFFSRVRSWLRDIFGMDDDLGAWDIVDHYGCPNSKRIEKLNVKRKQYFFQEG